MSQTYEAMVMLSNQVVREDWRKAKAMVGDMFTKHGCTIKSLRRYEERRLAYPIKGNLRATYYLAFFEIPGDNMPGLRRDMELSEPFLRNLITAVDGIPEGELALAAEEEDSSYTVPEPPADDEPDEEEVPEGEEGEEGSEEGKEEGEAGEKSPEKPAETTSEEKPTEDKTTEGDVPAETTK